MSFVQPRVEASNLRAGSTARSSTPAKVYEPDAPCALFIVGASPAELANLDVQELVRIARREAA